MPFWKGRAMQKERRERFQLAKSKVVSSIAHPINYIILENGLYFSFIDSMIKDLKSLCI